MEHLSNDQKDCTNQHKNIHKQCNKTRSPGTNIMKSQWKLRQRHDLNLPMEGKLLYIEQITASDEKIKPKGQDCENHSQ